MRAYPQVLVNAKVANEKKFDFDKDEEIVNEIKALEKNLKEMEEYLSELQEQNH